MNRSIIILVVVVAVALTGVLMAFFLYSSPISTGSQNTDQFPSQQGTPQTSATITVPQAMQTPEAVRAAFQKNLPAGNQTQLHATVVVGGYALQEWSNEPMGGETLLKYDTATSQWIVIANTGGSFSVAGLHKEGVPQRTVLALLAGLPK